MRFLEYFCARKLFDGSTRQELAVELAKPENLGDQPIAIKSILDAAEVRASCFARQIEQIRDAYEEIA